MVHAVHAARVGSGGPPPVSRGGCGTAMPVLVGTSGWQYRDWRGVLYPHGAALCWADRLGRPVTPLWRTADWGYLRFHEGAAQPWPRYGTQALRGWVQRVAGTWPDDAELFAYFNNDQGGAALHDAAAFAA